MSEILGISIIITLIAFLGTMYTIGILYFELSDRIRNLENQISKHSSINDFSIKESQKEIKIK